MVTVKVTERARQELLVYKPDDGPVTLRMMIEMGGGWSATSYYDLALDEPRPADVVFEQGDVTVVVDRTTYFYIDEPLKIDYEDGAYRIRASSHVIPDRIKL